MLNVLSLCFSTESYSVQHSTPLVSKIYTPPHYLNPFITQSCNVDVGLILLQNIRKNLNQASAGWANLPYMWN